MDQGYHALLVGFDRELAARVRAALALPEKRVMQIPADSTSLELVPMLTQHAVLIRYPAGDLEIRRLLQVIRSPKSRCRQAGVVIVADRSEAAAAGVCCDSGANRVVVVDDLQNALPVMLRSTVDVARRLQVKIPSRIESMAGSLRLNQFCQTVNVSATGMLLRTGRLLPLGTELRFELQLPDHGAPVRGSARVVRHAMERRERLAGIGVAFAGFENDDARAFADRLATLSA